MMGDIIEGLLHGAITGVLRRHAQREIAAEAAYNWLNQLHSLPDGKQ